MFDFQQFPRTNAYCLGFHLSTRCLTRGLSSLTKFKVASEFTAIFDVVFTVVLNTFIRQNCFQFTRCFWFSFLTLQTSQHLSSFDPFWNFQHGYRNHFFSFSASLIFLLLSRKTTLLPIGGTYSATASLGGLAVVKSALLCLLVVPRFSRTIRKVLHRKCSFLLIVSVVSRFSEIFSRFLKFVWKAFFHF